MTSHDEQMLGAYLLGALEPREVEAVEAHVAACPVCRVELEELRAMKDTLGELPPEALLDGPPDGADLALQRTLRQVRTERSAVRRRRGLTIAAAAVLAGAVLAGGGIAAGRAMIPDAPDSGVPPLAAGSVVAAQEDSETGAQATVMLRPDADGIQLDTFITGIPEGEECEVVVVASDGTAMVAATWIVSAEAAVEGSQPGGSAPIAPEDVDSVLVRNMDDTEFVTVPFSA